MCSSNFRLQKFYSKAIDILSKDIYKLTEFDMDHIEERRFVLNSFEYIFDTNHITLPTCLGDLMNTLNCREDTTFDSTMRLALKEIIKNQHPVRQRMHKHDLETYYHKKVSEAYSERELLEFLCFNIGSSILDTLLNPYAAVVKYRMIMSVIINAKARNEFTSESHSKLKDAAEEVIIESILRKQSRDVYLQYRPACQVQTVGKPSTSSEEGFTRMQGGDNYLKRRSVNQALTDEKPSTSFEENIQSMKSRIDNFEHTPLHRVQTDENPSSRSEVFDGNQTVEKSQLHGDITQGLKRKLDYAPNERKSLKTDCEKQDKFEESIDGENYQPYENAVRDKIRILKNKISDSIQVYKRVLKEFNNKKCRLIDITEGLEEIEAELCDLEISKTSDMRNKSL